jgi:hypothetical protein
MAIQKAFCNYDENLFSGVVFSKQSKINTVDFYPKETPFVL